MLVVRSVQSLSLFAAPNMDAVNQMDKERSSWGINPLPSSVCLSVTGSCDVAEDAALHIFSVLFLPGVSALLSEGQ